MASSCFFSLFFLGMLVHRVGLRPAFGFVALLGLVEVDVGVASGLGEVGMSKLNMGSPSSSNRWAVSITNWISPRAINFCYKIRIVEKKSFVRCEKKILEISIESGFEVEVSDGFRTKSVVEKSYCVRSNWMF